MPHPIEGYRNAQGERVPSVTTILSRFKDSGALIHWANTIAYEPYRQIRATLENILEQVLTHGALPQALIDEAQAHLAKPANHCDYRTVRDKAAGVGSIVHARVDSHIRRISFDYSLFANGEYSNEEAVLQASETGFQAFLKWAGSTSFELAEGEVQLVSQVHNFGGTPDVVMVNGERLVGDWKTGALYPQQIIPQLAAYRELLFENGHEVGHGGHAISIDKKTGGFTHRFITTNEMLAGLSAFLRMRSLYSLLKELK